MDDQVSRAAWKSLINLICKKISDSTASQPGKRAGLVPYNHNPGRPAHRRR